MHVMGSAKKLKKGKSVMGGTTSPKKKKLKKSRINQMKDGTDEVLFLTVLLSRGTILVLFISGYYSEKGRGIQF